MMDLFLRHNQWGTLDLDMSNGDIAICPTQSDYIAQIIATRLKIIEGEWFLDASLGIPYFTQVFGHKRNERFIRQLIMPEIQSIPGVREITNFTTEESPNRRLTISFEAVMDDGTALSFKEFIGV